LKFSTFKYELQIKFEIPFSILTFLYIVSNSIKNAKEKKPAKIMISFTRVESRIEGTREGKKNRLFFSFSTLLYCRDEQKELRGRAKKKL
jgi:hypothetical protein